MNACGNDTCTYGLLVFENQHKIHVGLAVFAHANTYMYVQVPGRV